VNDGGKRSGKPPTIRDVAELASVAPATVSNVLTGRRPVAEDRKQRVLAAVAQLGYRPNHLAASLRRQETRTIGIVIPDLTNPFFAALVHRIEELAAEADYQILLMSSNEDTEQEAHRVDVLLARQTDGLIIAPARDDVSAFAASAADLPPTVLVDRGFGLAGFDTIAADNYDAAKRGCQHLISLGHTDIVLVVSDSSLANIADRIAAGDIEMVFNTPYGREARSDGYFIRTAAVEAGVPCITTMSAMAAAVQAIEATDDRDAGVRPLQEYLREMNESIGQ